MKTECRARPPVSTSSPDEVYGTYCMISRSSLTCPAYHHGETPGRHPNEVSKPPQLLSMQKSSGPTPKDVQLKHSIAWSLRARPATRDHQIDSVERYWQQYRVLASSTVCHCIHQNSVFSLSVTLIQSWWAADFMAVADPGLVFPEEFRCSEVYRFLIWE